MGAKTSRTVGTVLAMATALVGLSVPSAAHAATAGSPLYVDKVNPACSDSGGGTQIVPFCTVQAAVDAAGPGSDILLSDNTYHESVVITRSGTADAPITLEPAPGLPPDDTALDGLTIQDAAHIRVQGLVVDSPELPGWPLVTPVVVTGSSDVRLDRMYVADDANDAWVVHVTGSSSDVTLSRSYVEGSTSLVLVDGASSGTVLTTNDLGGEESGFDDTAVAVSLNGVTGSAVTSNSVGLRCGTGIDVRGAANGSTIENNSVSLGDPTANNPDCHNGMTGLSIAADSAASLHEDYNDLPLYTATTPFRWQGEDYPTVDAYRTASGQGEHDRAALVTSPDFAAAAVDSADATAPGELDTDILGRGRADDPLVADTGTGVGYVDRGAMEAHNTFSNTVQRIDRVGARVVDLVTGASESWPLPMSVTVDWGDGRTGEFDGVTPAFLSTPHTYARAGRYTITTTRRTSSGSSTYTETFTQTLYTLGTTFAPVAPRRVLDTRNGTGRPGKRTTRLAAGASLTVKVTGDAAPQGHVKAALLDVTVVKPASSGWLSVTQYPSSGESTMAFTKGGTVADPIVVSVAPDGTVVIKNTSAGPVDVLADLEGFYGDYEPGSKVVSSGYVASGLTRLLDTRKASGKSKARKVPAKSSITLRIRGAKGVPDKAISAVVLNTTALDTGAAGSVSVYPGGTARTAAAGIEVTGRGQTVSNLVTVPVGADGTVRLYNGTSKPLDLVADLEGIYTPGGGLAFVPGGDTIVDTRWKRQPSWSKGPLKADGTLAIPDGRFPVDSLTAVPVDYVLNVTVVGPTKPGYLTVRPSTRARPLESDLEFAKGQTIANMVVTTSAPKKSIDFYNGSGGRTNVVVDLLGYFG
jgi:hypothetical protein